MSTSFWPSAGCTAIRSRALGIAYTHCRQVHDAWCNWPAPPLPCKSSGSPDYLTPVLAASAVMTALSRTVLPPDRAGDGVSCLANVRKPFPRHRAPCCAMTRLFAASSGPLAARWPIVDLHFTVRGECHRVDRIPLRAHADELAKRARRWTPTRARGGRRPRMRQPAQRACDVE